ncbi:MAG TPA: neutral/alkaline non-lysosomal ceramidase N-terminal domain-containing protein, partial [Armatimonadota bacterium]|nr:neutral/alkaline non-lysosomal ceramidase N-terminal domain-containing protein [Armatimonadota bacterium]
MTWQVGIGRRVITPSTPVWLAGYGSERAPDGTIHELWVKVLALQDPSGKRVVLATTDHMGMSKTIYERLYASIQERFGLERAEFMLTFSHNHCGPVLEDDLVDYYPMDDEQRRLVAEYSLWMEGEIADAVGEALDSLRPGRLHKGEGLCTFAVNRRENPESEVPGMVAAGTPLKGAVDHYVPVLAVRGEADELLAVLFGYACHPTTLSFNTWCGDYPGFAQVNLEENLPGTSAMFFNACGADQNPIPRRTVELAEKYGKMLSDGVEEALAQPMQPVSTGLRAAFEFVDLDYDEIVTRETLLPVANGNSELHARWANRMLKMIDEGVVFPTSYPYPVQAWSIGDELLLIGIGGEAVVDYSLRFKREFGPKTWVCGYANDMAAYIPSRRVWEEGGYEGGRHLDEYGRPAWRWAGDVEDRIADSVHRLVTEVSPSPNWVQVAEHAEWAPRDSCGEVVLGGKMWLLGGWFNSNSIGPRDVWSSAN